MGVHEEPLPNPADILASIVASGFYDLPTPTCFEVLDRQDYCGPLMAGIQSYRTYLRNEFGG
eukprot:6191277-Pleurochrysis_carterae.AAC.1